MHASMVMLWVAGAALVGADGKETADSATSVFAEGSLSMMWSAEAGFLLPLSHTIQFGEEGSRFDYVSEGGQDNLFAVMRVAATAQWRQRHAVTLLYQPLQLDTRIAMQRRIELDGVTFAEGTPVDLRYGFSFWRGSYAYRAAAFGPGALWLGVSLQLRNATIDFTQNDGSSRLSNRDVGPVPLLKALFYSRGKSTWYQIVVDGIWAPVRYFNGGTSDVEGAFVDASIRFGAYQKGGIEPFVGLRYLGGGAKGTGEPDNPGGDGFVSNWLQFVTVTLGVAVR